MFLFRNVAISRKAKKQRTVALSGTEYIGLAEAAKEALYLRIFLVKLGLHVLIVSQDQQ